MRVGGRIGRHHHLRVEAEFLLDRHGRVGKVGDVAVDLVHNVLHARQRRLAPANPILSGGGLFQPDES